MMQLVALMIALTAGVPQDAGPKADRSSDNELARNIRSVVEENMLATEKEDVHRVLKTCHPESPTRSEAEAILEILQHYDLKFSVLQFRLIGHDGTYACARVRHLTEWVAGPAFRNNILDSIWVFRRHDGKWKVWTQVTLATEFVETNYGSGKPSEHAK